MPPKLVRRPAARVKAAPKAGGLLRRGVLRRPAVAQEDPQEAFESGKEVTAGSIDPAPLLTCGRVWCTDLVYWKETTQCVGRFRSLRYEEGEAWMDIEVEGTKSEHLLKYLSGIKQGKIQGHICPEGCSQEISGDSIVHVLKVKKLEEKDALGWMGNLLAVGRDPPDELDLLRQEAREGGARSPPAGREGDPLGAKDKKEKKEKEKVKKKKEKRQRSTSPEQVRRKGGRDLGVVLGESGLDPDPKRRRRFLRKAKRLMKKKKRKRSSSSSSRSSSKDDSSGSSASTVMAASELFGQTKMAKRVAARCPGVLTASSLSAVQEQLLTSQGQMWDLDRRELPPIFLQYFRGHLAARMQPAMRREAVHVSYCLDLGLQGKIPQLLDTLAQRLKALEGQTMGKHWSVTSQYELVPEEQGSVATAQETQEAAREAREASKLRSMAGRPYGSGQERGDEWRRENQKGKGSKGQGKGKEWRKDSKAEGRDFRREKEDEKGKEKSKGKGG
jgi:hypothetical protein